MSGEEVDVGDEKREDLCQHGKPMRKKCMNRQLVALLLRQTCRNDVGRRSDQRSVACMSCR